MATYATPLYRLRTPVEEIGEVLLVVMRRGSLSAAEEITGHKWETIRNWPILAGEHAERLTDHMVHQVAQPGVVLADHPDDAPPRGFTSSTLPRTPVADRVAREITTTPPKRPRGPLETMDSYSPCLRWYST